MRVKETTGLMKTPVVKMARMVRKKRTRLEMARTNLKVAQTGSLRSKTSS